MKANAPEKIYIQSFNVSEEDAKFARKLYFDDVWTEEPESGQENIEYIRTDVFIEKARKWFIEHTNVSQEVDIDEDGEPLADSYIKYAKARFDAANEIFENFINYMKGE